MKAIHILLGLVLFLAFAAGGAALIVSPQYPDFIQMAIAFGASWPDGLKVAAGVVAVLAPLAYLLTGAASRRRKSFITFVNENGTVSVDTAVQEYLNSLKNEFAAVLWLKSKLRVVRGALDVGLVLGVRDGTRIPELCKLMQERTRELLEEHLGTCDLAGVAVEVAEIKVRKKPAGAAAEEPA
ncbi:MAG TPA: hypothetical protein PK388_01440 [Kiritimatiellia bacterium]|nr:hypothetical protein [Kiritimatiellia bacterium]